MPRALSDYALIDWLRLRPALEAHRDWQVRRRTGAFIRQPARVGDVDAIQAAMRGSQVMVTIAFNDPEILERQIIALRAFAPGPLHIIADNSNDPQRASEIATLCERLGTPYLRLPANPWDARSPSRSHGAALNWVWRRLIQPARPEAFGFLDHDLVPLALDDPFEALERQPVAGDKRWAGDRWYLWAGYCFFRMSAIEGLELDFGQDWSLGLDTGGGNWSALYSRLDPDAIAQRNLDPMPLFPDRATHECYYELRGAWLHEVGLHGLPALRAQKRARVLELIDEALINAGSATTTSR